VTPIARKPTLSVTAPPDIIERLSIRHEKTGGSVMVKAAIAALIVLLTFLAVVKLTDLAPLVI
jgi:hypothetical protein